MKTASSFGLRRVVRGVAFWAVACTAIAGGLPAQSAAPSATPRRLRPPPPEAPRVGLFDSVTTLLLKGWPNAWQRSAVIEPAIAELRDAAATARTVGDEIAVVQRLLRQVPLSHTGLTSATGAASLTKALYGTVEPMFGLQLLRWDGKWFATSVLDGGPAARAGVLPWNEIVSIDGLPPTESPRLDFSTDDAFLPDDRDPPVHGLLVEDAPQMVLGVRRGAAGSVETIPVTAASYSASEATAASVRVMELDGQVRIGVAHLWFMHIRPAIDWFGARFDDEWKDVDAVLLDLRGRGGSADLAERVADVLSESPHQRFRGPVVILQDRMTRSAKELTIDVLRGRRAAVTVGEPTAGAVVGSTSRALGHGFTLMLPTQVQPTGFAHLEASPIEPDVSMAWAGPYATRDPIFEAGLQRLLRLIDELGRGTVLPRPARTNPVPGKAQRIPAR